MGNKASSTNRRNKQGFLLNAADSTRTALTAPCENDEPQSSQTFKPSSNNNMSITIAMLFLEALNDQDTMLFGRIVSEYAIIRFMHSDARMLLRRYWETLSAQFEAFPDLAFTFTSVRETTPGTVVIDGFCASGHHMGAPMTLANEPSIPATGAYLENRPTTLTLKITNGKVEGVLIAAAECPVEESKLGSGPHELYYRSKAAWVEQNAN